MKLFAIPEWFIWLSFSAIFLAALWKGDWQARVLSGCQLTQMIYQRTWFCFSDICLGGLLDERLWQYILQDVLLTGIAVACSLTARRYWVLGVASLCLISLAMDFVIPHAHIDPFSWKWASYIWTYLVLLLVLSDVWLNLRDQRQAARLNRARRPVAA